MRCEAPVKAAMTARTGPLLWMSALVGLWTTTSLIETIRDVLHRAYGTCRRAISGIIGWASFAQCWSPMVLAMAAFSAQVLVIAALRIWCYRFMPAAEKAAEYFAWGRLSRSRCCLPPSM